MPDRKRSPINIIQSESFKYVILFILICLPLSATLSYYGITVDEPIYMEASWNIRKWLSLKPREMLNQETIDRYWKTDIYRNVHPSGVKWLYLTAQKIIPLEKDPYRQNGIFNIFIFSLSLALFLHWWTKGSFSREIIFILLMLTIPRFFAHIHFPATDIPMTSFMMLFIVCLDKTLFNKFFWLSGIILGLFVSIKITSFLLALPVLIVFSIWYKDHFKVLWPRILMICLIGIIVFYILNPDWWFSPLSRSKEFLTQSLTRHIWTPFTSYFGGRFYSYRAPFYYPFTMFFITTPLFHLLLLFSGLTLFFIKKELRTNFKMIISFTCLAVPFLILALPVSPAHDGIRYLLPAFPFAACFMALGFEKLLQFIRDSSSVNIITIAGKWITATLAVVLLAMDLNNSARYPPFELSYYNKIVGDLSGAHRRGYETTYWWEILNDSVLERLNRSCAGSTVYFPLPPTDFFFKHMIIVGKIKFQPVQDPNSANYILIFGRPFVKYWEIRILEAYRKMGKIPIPIWTVSLDSVPLLRLYSVLQKDKRK